MLNGLNPFLIRALVLRSERAKSLRDNRLNPFLIRALVLRLKSEDNRTTLGS